LIFKGEIFMPKTTIQDFLKKKLEKKKITMLTAYDYPFAQIVDEAGIDAILVGDSLGMVVQGLENTLPVTMDEMIYTQRWIQEQLKMQWSLETCRSCPIRHA